MSYKRPEKETKWFINHTPEQRYIARIRGYTYVRKRTRCSKDFLIDISASDWLRIFGGYKE